MIEPICKKCQTTTPKVKQQTMHSKVSLGFMYHLALDLQFSFQSIALLVDFAQKRQSQKFDIVMQKITDNENVQIPDQHYDENFIQVRFDGKALSKSQAQELGNSYHSRVKGGTDLVLSIFGIGKTGLFISNNGTETSYILYSVDDRVNPNYCKQQSAMIYIENNATKNIENLNGKLVKRIVMQGLKIYYPHPQKIMECAPNSSKVLIFHPKIFVSSNKLMFYEIRESNFSHDIDTHYNPQKIQFLNKLGYQMGIHAQFRLSCYLNCLHLQSPFPITIGQSKVPICKTSYIEYLETVKQNGLLTKLTEAKIQGATRIELFQTTQKYFIQNNGILLYWRGRMINRFQVEFGRMLEEKFFMKRYRSPPRNIWNVVGVIELDSNKFTPNLIKNKFVNSYEYRRFCRDLKMLLDNLDNKFNSINLQSLNEESQRQGKVDSSEYLPSSEPRKRVKHSKDYGDAD